MAVMTQEQAYLALHRDYEKALAERRKLIEALREIADGRELPMHEARELLRELGAEK